MTVYRLITKTTVDENIYNLSQRKLKLDAGGSSILIIQSPCPATHVLSFLFREKNIFNLSQRKPKLDAGGSPLFCMS